MHHTSTNNASLSYSNTMVPDPTHNSNERTVLNEGEEDREEEGIAEEEVVVR